jgi:iron complex outermembrane receptor protein
VNNRYLASVSFAALLATAPSAGAQSPPPVRPAASSGIEEVIVTATKVRTNLQKTPIAITSIPGKSLVRAGVTNPQELNKLVVGLQVEQNGPGSSIFIRGVGSRTLAPTQDPGVAFSVDGVYYNRTLGISTTFFDVARIEVVKGPQGTLYGRNATGGAVDLVTNKPDLTQPHVDATLELGNYHDVRFQGAVSDNFSDQVAARVAVESNSHSGYLTDGYDDEDVKGVRPSVLWKVNNDLSVSVSADYEHEGGNGAGVVPVGPGGYNNALTTRFADPSNPWTGPSEPAINAVLHTAAPAGALPPMGAPGTFCVGVPISLTGGAPANVPGSPAILTCQYPIGVSSITKNGFLDNSYFGSNVTVSDNLGFTDLTFIGGFRGTRLDSLFRVDPTTQLQIADANQGSLEMRLTSRPDSGPFKWLVGGFWLLENQQSSAVIQTDNSGISNPSPPPGSPLPATTCINPIGPGVCLVKVTAIENSFALNNPDLSDETYAGFGQGIYSVFPWLRLSGGIRYTHETKSANDGEITENYTLPAGASVSYPSEGTVSFNNLTYRAGLEIDVAPRSMIYASFTTGFHAGGQNLGVAQGPNTYAFQPETVKNYVVGIKNRFFDNKVQFNVEGFYLTYDNFQVQSLGRINDGSYGCSTLLIVNACPLALRIDNAATAVSRGVETDFIWRVIDNGTLNVDFLYDDNELGTFLQANPFGGAPTDYSNTNLPGASKTTITAGYTQAFDLPNGGQIVAGASTQFKNNTWMFYEHAPGNFQKAYTRTDLTLGYSSASRRWDVTGFVRNVENHATLLNGTTVDPVTNLPWVNLNPPRTFGGILSYHF